MKGQRLNLFKCANTFYNVSGYSLLGGSNACNWTEPRGKAFFTIKTE